MKNLRVDFQSIFIFLLPFILLTIVDRSHSAPALEGDDSDGGCYYMFNHYGEGDRIFTNEPCLNCTCHNSMLMCYLRVCPFTKPIGQDCTIEKKPDQCCPVISCPEVPVSLVTPSTLTSTTVSTTSLATVPDSTDLAIYERGCNIEGKFYPDGAQVEGDPSKPCELCYCIRNRTACVMQECILHVEGCQPVFQDGVCCPVRYRCEYPPQLTDETTVAGLITTTIKSIFTSTPVPGGCVKDGEWYADGSQIPGATGPCEHCYCMRGEIVCAVQECGAPLQNEGGNCTAIAPPKGMCCPEKYSCDGDQVGEEGSTTVPSVPEQDVGVTSEPEAPKASDEPETQTPANETQADEKVSDVQVESSSVAPGETEGEMTKAPDMEDQEDVAEVSTPQSQPSVPSEPELVEGVTPPSASSSSKEPEKAVSVEDTATTLAPNVPEQTTVSAKEPEQVQDERDSTGGPPVIELDTATTLRPQVPDSSSEAENLITAATENVLVVSEPPKPADSDKGVEESTESPERPSDEIMVSSSERPEVTTISSASEESDSGSTISPSAETSSETLMTSSESGQSSSTESSEKSTEQPPSISEVGKPQEILEDHTEIPVPETTSHVAIDQSAVKDQQVEEATIKPISEQEPDVTTLPPQSEDISPLASSSVPPSEDLQTGDGDKQTTSEKPGVEELPETTVSSSVTPDVEDAKVPQTTVSVDDEIATTPRTQASEGETAPETEGQKDEAKPVGEEEKGAGSVTEPGPVESGSSTTIPTQETPGSSTPEGDVIGEMHISSTPEPAESLAMQSTTSKPETENQIAEDKISSDDTTEPKSTSESPATSTQETVTTHPHDGEEDVKAKVTEQPSQVTPSDDQVQGDEGTTQASVVPSVSGQPEDSKVEPVPTQVPEVEPSTIKPEGVSVVEGDVTEIPVTGIEAVEGGAEGPEVQMTTQTVPKGEQEEIEKTTVAPPTFEEPAVTTESAGPVDEALPQKEAQPEKVDDTIVPTTQGPTSEQGQDATMTPESVVPVTESKPSEEQESSTVQPQEPSEVVSSVPSVSVEPDVVPTTLAPTEEGKEELVHEQIPQEDEKEQPETSPKPSDEDVMSDSKTTMAPDVPSDQEETVTTGRPVRPEESEPTPGSVQTDAEKPGDVTAVPQETTSKPSSGEVGITSTPEVPTAAEEEKPEGVDEEKVSPTTQPPKDHVVDDAGVGATLSPIVPEESSTSPAIPEVDAPTTVAPSEPSDIETKPVEPVEVFDETPTTISPPSEAVSGADKTVDEEVQVQTTVTPDKVEEMIPTTAKPIVEGVPDMVDIGVSVQPPVSPEISDMKNMTVEEAHEVPTTTETPSSTEEQEPPSGVPGEGSCFVEGKTFKNGSSIPPMTPCHIVCACQNSIVHCLLVHCNPPPSDTGDCKPIYKQGVCCPTYDCEGSQQPALVTVTPGPISVNESIVTVTPETTSSDANVSDDNKIPETTLASVGGDSESSESSGAQEDDDDKPLKPVSDDTDEDQASPLPPTTTPAAIIEESSSSSPVSEEPEIAVNVAGPMNITDEEVPLDASTSSETPLPSVSSSTPLSTSEEHPVEEEQNVSSEEVSSSPVTQTPGSLYPVTTTTTVTPSSAGWPYPTSTPAPVMSAGACLFDGRVYMSAQQIPRDDPCDFCFCFRGDIICLQQSCPPPIPGCYEEPIPGFCCPRYECPVGNGNSTTQPSVFPPSYYHNQILNGVAQGGNSGGAVAPSLPAGPGCEVQGEYYESGSIIQSVSGPCLECRCGSTGMMECDPRECQPEPMLRKMIAAITSR